MKAIEYMDLFGTTCKFYIEKKQKYYTVYGGILSILSIIISFSLFILLNYNQFKRDTPAIVTTSTLPSVGYRKIKFGKEKIWIPWRIMNYAQQYVNHTNILFPVISYRKGHKIPGTTGIHLVNKILPYKLCNETSMKNLDRSIFFIDSPINEYYCIDMDEIEMGGGWDNDFIYFIQLDVYLCENGTKYDANKCTSYDTLKNIIGVNNSWAFEFLYPLVQFQPVNLKHPGSILYKNAFFHLSRFTNKIHRLFLQEHVINDDLGWFRNSKKNMSFWGMSSISGDDYFTASEQDLINEGSNSRLYSLNIYLDMGIVYSTRSYKKIHQLLIETLPILFILFSLLKNITKIFKSTSTNKKLSELLFENVVKKLNKFNQVSNCQQVQVYSSNNKVNIYSNQRFNELLNNQNQKNFNSKDHSSFIQLPNNDSNIINKLGNDKNLPKKSYGRSLSISKEIKNSMNYKLQRKALFPYKYYFFSFFLKTIDIKKCKKYFSYQFISAYSYLSQLLDINSYLSLQKQFGLLKKSLLNERNLNFVESEGKININNNNFLRNISESINENKLNLFTQDVAKKNSFRNNHNIARIHNGNDNNIISDLLKNSEI